MISLLVPRVSEVGRLMRGRTTRKAATIEMPLMLERQVRDLPSLITSSGMAHRGKDCNLDAGLAPA